MAAITVAEFAKSYKSNGIALFVDKTAQDFAVAWANVCMANYFFTMGMNMLNQAEAMMPPEEQSSIIT